MSGPEQMVDIAERRFGKKAQTVHIDRQDLLATEFLDADMLVGQFLPGGGVVSKGEEIVTGYLSGRLFVALIEARS